MKMFALWLAIPDAEEPPDRHELTQMVGVVVGHQECFTQERLTLPVRDRGEQVRTGGGHLVRHPAQIGSERREGR